MKFEIKGVNAQTRKNKSIKKHSEWVLNCFDFAVQKRINHFGKRETSKINRQLTWKCFLHSLNHLFCDLVFERMLGFVEKKKMPQSNGWFQFAPKWHQNDKTKIKSGQMINAKWNRTSIFCYPHILKWKIYCFLIKKPHLTWEVKKTSDRRFIYMQKWIWINKQFRWKYIDGGKKRAMRSKIH